MQRPKNCAISRPPKRVAFRYSHWAKIAQPLLHIWTLKTPIYAPNKIGDNGTADRVRPLEVLCEGVSTRFGRRTLAKHLERIRPFGCSVFPNLRLGSLPFCFVSKIVLRWSILVLVFYIYHTPVENTYIVFGWYWAYHFCYIVFQCLVCLSFTISTLCSPNQPSATSPLFFGQSPF